MPIYEYSCQACSERFELLVPMSEASKLPPCPSCKSADTRKMLSLFARTGTVASSTALTPSAAPKPSGHGGCGGCGCGH